MSPTKRKRQKGKPDESARLAAAQAAQASEASAEVAAVRPAPAQRAPETPQAAQPQVADGSVADTRPADGAADGGEVPHGDVFSSAITAPLPKIAVKREAPKKRAKRTLRRAEGKKRTPDGEEAAADAADAAAASTVDGAANAAGHGGEALKQPAADGAAEDAAGAADAAAGEASDTTADASDADAGPSRPSVKGNARARRVAGIVASVVAVAVIACAAAFSWDRWLRYDDAADIQGSWIAEGGTTAISIDGENIVLARDAVLSYRIDPFAKTISYDLGTMAGEGRYRFSADRQQLAIDDGAASWFDTASQDIVFGLQSAFATVMGSEQPALSATAGGVVLVREGAQADAAAGDAATDAAEDAAGDDAAASGEGVDDAAADDGSDSEPVDDVPAEAGSSDAV